MNLEFLKDVTLQPIVEEKKVTKRAAGIAHLPEGMTIRLFKSGRIYASAELAAKYDLQFGERSETIDPIAGDVQTITPGHGIDIFGSRNWSMVSGLEQPVLFIGFVPREGNTKIDLWGSTKYNKETGLPVSDIFEQGVATFAKKSLIPMITEYYNVNWEEVGYVDLTVETDYPMVSPNAVYHIPKFITRGENEGKPTYSRRESIDIFPLSVNITETLERFPASDEQEVQTEIKFEAKTPIETKAESAEDMMNNADAHFANSTQEDVSNLL